MIRSLAAGIVLTVMNAAAGPPGPSLDVPRQRGRAEIVSEEQRWEGDLLIASGMVHLRYRDMVLEADRIELDDSTKDVVAMGNVVLHEGERRIAGERAFLSRARLRASCSFAGSSSRVQLRA